MIRMLAAILLLPCAALFVWLGLSRSPPRADFVMAGEEPRTLDPQRVSWNTELIIAGAMFEGLTRPNPRTLAPEPGVAESWETSPDQRVWTFHLRPAARWSDGRPVTAEDFRWSWMRLLERNLAAQYASLLFVVRGAETRYREGAGEVGVEALDERTLRVELAAPCSYFLDLTSFPTLAPVPRQAVERFDARDGPRRDYLWMRPQNIVCNGAFVLRDWRFKQRVLLTRNACYWDTSAVALDSIELAVYADSATALAAYETGRVDLVRNIPAAIARALVQHRPPRSDLHVGDRFATYFYRVNCARPPLDDANLRAALGLAIDKAALCTNVLSLGEKPADTYVPPAAISSMLRRSEDGGVVEYEPPASPGGGLDMPARIALARTRLAESRYRAGVDRPIELMFAGDNPDYRRVAEALQAMWRENLGLAVELRPLEGKVISQRIRDLDYDLARSDWFGDYLDPSTFLDMFTTGSGQNRTGWSNPEYDRLVRAAAAEPDNRTRYRLLSAGERILCEQFPILPLYYWRGAVLIRPELDGLYDNLRESFVIQFARRRAGVAAAAYHSR